MENLIANIVINYQNETEVIEYAKELRNQTYFKNIVLVIVINKINLNLEEYLIEKINTIGIRYYIYNPGCNLGYLNGIIYGYEQLLLELEEKPNWIVISNTDIKIGDCKFFEKFNGNKYNENVWVIGPSVYSPNTKSYSNPQYIKKVTKRKIKLTILIFSIPLLAFLYINLATLKARLFKNSKRTSCKTYSVHGCFFIISSKLADILAKRKYKALMYSEEAYIAGIVESMNKECFYDSTLEVFHEESTVTSKLGIKNISKYVSESLNIILEEFYQ